MIEKMILSRILFFLCIALVPWPVTALSVLHLEKMEKLQPLIMVFHGGHRTKPRIQRCSSLSSIRNRIVLFNHLNVFLFVFPGIFFLSNQKKKWSLCKGKKISKATAHFAALNPFIFRIKKMIKRKLSCVCKPCSLRCRRSFGSSRNPP